MNEYHQTIPWIAGIQMSEPVEHGPAHYHVQAACWCQPRAAGPSTAYDAQRTCKGSYAKLSWKTDCPEFLRPISPVDCTLQRQTALVTASRLSQHEGASLTHNNWVKHLTTTGCHFPHGITQLYPSPDTSDTLPYPLSPQRYSIYISINQSINQGLPK